MRKGSNDFPFPNPYELLRTLLNALDLKHTNKQLDERALERNYDYRELEQIINGVAQSAEKYIGPSFSQLLTKFIRKELAKYLRLVGETATRGLPKNAVLSILQLGLLPSMLRELALSIHDEFQGPIPAQLFSHDTSAVSTVLAWLSNHVTFWDAHLASMKKEDRDRLAVWSKGIDLPSSVSIRTLEMKNANPVDSDCNWQQIKSLLLWARMIEYIKRSSDGDQIIGETRILLLGGSLKHNIYSAFECAKLIDHVSLGAINRQMYLLKQEFDLAAKKDFKRCKEILETVKNELTQANLFTDYQFWINFYEARFQVFSGNLEPAIHYYKLAFEHALFRAGLNLKSIIEEALIIASCLDTPDKVFLKHLKWAHINFGYDIPSISTSTPSNKFDDSIEPWEIRMWRCRFLDVFPAHGWFEGTHYDAIEEDYGFIHPSAIAQIKPNYRRPNQMIKIGKAKKRMPQLVWFVRSQQYNVCEKLLEAGAKVDVSSELNETPLMMALEPLKLSDIMPKSNDDRFFRLLSNYPHMPETINMRTQKQRILPLISAVESGRLDIVTKLLDMGADPNRTGKTDDQTALNVCLKLIGFLKNPTLATSKQRDMAVGPDALDSIRRQTGGYFGHALEAQQQMLSDPRFRTLWEAIQETLPNRIQEKLDIDTMRKIAVHLIKSGADSNITFRSPVKGYTPLMLAAELDEDELFNLMLVNGGNPKTSFYYEAIDQDWSCFQIARAHKSMKVMRLLEDISPNLQGA
ncbi:ankyrin repeat domain-containing protein [Shewanella algae]|uniref:ankyrin repeat domain-containing protein n=2 Tax=Shewanella algae TaxID=38313 RepID=UPI0031F59DE8